METHREDGIATFHAPDQQAWRNWLEANHNTAKKLWLIIFRKHSPTPSIMYNEAVDEALCFGWIDSKSNKRDEESFYQFFAKRNPKSNWSKVNKDKVSRLLAEGRIAPAGQAMIDLAKETGTWTALDDVEAMVIPDDLLAALTENAPAYEYFVAFPRSVKRGILEWINTAKQPETRQKRVFETALKAAQNIRANQWRP